MTKTMTQQPEGLALLEKAKQKLTLIVPGMGNWGADARIPIVTRGLVYDGTRLVPGYSEPRAKKVYNLTRILANGAILLRGHVTEKELPIFESDISYEAGSGMSMRSLVLDGRGGRFVDAYGDGTGRELLMNLRKHLLFHTLDANRSFVLRAKKTVDGPREGEILDAHFENALIAVLGPPVEVSPAAPAPPARTTLFTDAMKEKLVAANGVEPVKPLFRLFQPDSPNTWLVCSMEPDGDTLWVVADLGLGIVEYGTASLEELETTVSGRFKMHIERDRHWLGTDKPMSEILGMTSIQTGV